VSATPMIGTMSSGDDCTEYSPRGGTRTQSTPLDRRASITTSPPTSATLPAAAGCPRDVESDRHAIATTSTIAAASIGRTCQCVSEPTIRSCDGGECAGV
jgi:hypothetical protein